MALITFRQFGAAGISAVYREAPGGGGIFDLDAPRNRPAKFPAQWLSHVLFHSDFDYYQAALGPQLVTVNHAAVAGAITTVVSKMSYAVQRAGQIVETAIELVHHGLGYAPRYAVISGGQIIAPGATIQVEPSCERSVTPFATTGKIMLRDVGISSSSPLSALSKQYLVVVYRQPLAEGQKLFDFASADAGTILGRDKFNSRRKMFRQAGAGDNPFGVSLGPTDDIGGGAVRTVLADGTTLTGTGYAGSFTGSASILGAVD